MKQLTFFEEDAAKNNSEKCQKRSDDAWQLYIDGASRNNPGPAGAGFSLLKNNEVVCEQGFFLGNRTNNQAEYFALLLGLFFAKKFIENKGGMQVYADSQLLIRQMRKEYRVKDEVLKKMQGLANELAQDYDTVFCHVYREHNKEADRLANRGIDKKAPLPKRFLDMLKRYDIS